MFVQNVPELRLKEAMDSLAPSDHPCLIYQTESEKYDVLIPFFQTGLERGERCLYVYNDSSPDKVLDILVARGIDALREIAKGALVLVAAKDFYPDAAEFDHDKVFASIEKELIASQEAGFTGIRAAGEMESSPKSDNSIERIIEYDAKLNHFLLDRRVMVLCLYNRNQYPTESLIKVIRAHPKVIFNGVLCTNHAYLPPEEFFSPARRDFVLEHLLHGALANETMLTDLREKSLLLKAVVENTTDAVYIKDSRGRYLMINQAGASFLGRSIDEVLGRDDTELFSPDSARKIYEFDSTAKTSHEPMTFEETITAKGVTRTYLSTKGAYRDASGNVVGLFGIARDITDRKCIEKSLQESEELFRTLCDSAPIGIFKSDRDGNYIYCNARWEEISGMSCAESGGQGWTSAVHPEDRPLLAKERDRINQGRRYSLEYRILRPDGRTVWIRVLGSPLTDQDGRVTGYVGTVEDITEIHEVKQETLKAQKLESLGVLAGGIAHDFNNLLSAILGNVSLAQLQIHDTEKTKHRLREAEQAVIRATSLTQQLLTFARGGEPVKSVIQLGGLLQELAHHSFDDSRIELKILIPGDLWPVEADKGQINLVVFHLVTNAAQAMPQGGTITIEARNVLKGNGNTLVELSVADSGTGIRQEHLDKIFDPYFTTKEQGTGLGLSTCYSIIDKHGGYITVLSIPGTGSTFQVYLPAAKIETKPQAESRQALSSGHGRILVMDDEKQVREITKAILESLGYVVECAVDGAEALDLYRKWMDKGTPFDVVILDLTIPCGIGGKETIAALLEIDPNVTAIVSSGYSSDPVMANFQEYGFRSVLAKPYRIQDISEVLENLV